MAITVPTPNTMIDANTFGAPVANQLNALVPTAWTFAPLTNGWVHQSGEECKYRKVGDVVQLRGRVGVGAMGIIFTLPVGFRPPITQEFAVASVVTGGWTIGVIQVGPDGVVYALAGSNSAMTLNNITFSTTV